MKNLLKICLILICPFIALNALAQGADMPIDAEADALLKEVSAKYKSNSTAKIELELIIELPEYDTEEAMEVVTWVKGDMFKIDLPGQVFVSDNVTMWNYMKEYDEVQINNFDASNAVFSPSVIFDMYNDKYIYRMKESFTKDGAKYNVVELVPIDKDEEFFKIELTIDMKDKSIAQSKVFEKSGTKYIYKINSFTPNVPLADDFFTFDVKNIATVVDLRF